MLGSMMVSLKQPEDRVLPQSRRGAEMMQRLILKQLTKQKTRLPFQEGGQASREKLLC